MNVADLLTTGLNACRRKLNRRLIDGLCARFEAWKRDGADRMPEESFELLLVEFLRTSVFEDLEFLGRLDAENDEFRRILGRTPDEHTRRLLILEYAGRLGADRRQLGRDRRAFRRWHGADAVNERYLARRGRIEQTLAFALERLGAVAGRRLESCCDDERTGEAWKRLKLELLVHRVFESAIDRRVQLAALRCLSLALLVPEVGWALPTIEGRSVIVVGKAHPAALAFPIEAATISLLVRLAGERTADVWVQSEALAILSAVAGEVFDNLLTHRLTERGGADDLFVRRRAVLLLGRRARHNPSLYRLLPTIAEDNSEFVRQGLCEILVDAPAELARQWFWKLAREDRSPKVRAAALVQLLRLGKGWGANVTDHEASGRSQRSGVRDRESAAEVARLWPNSGEFGSVRTTDHGQRTTDHDSRTTVDALQLLENVINEEADPFVLRTAAHVAAEWIAGGGQPVGPACRAGPDEAQKRPQMRRQEGTIRQEETRSSPADWTCTELLASLCRARERVESIPLRRELALACERIWVSLHPEARNLLAAVAERWGRVSPGRARRLPGRWLPESGEETLVRTLSVLAQDDFGYDVERGFSGVRLRRGPKKRWRLWRVWHELRHASPDKRQAFRHTIGRVSDAQLRAPSAVMGELSETKVPGEPLVLEHESSWKPFLPLVDDVLSSLNQLYPVRPLRIYSSEGVTELRPPRSPLKRLRAWLTLNVRFARFAALRNWREDSQNRPDEYVEALRRLGFDVAFRPHEYDGDRGPTSVLDESVQRYFGDHREPRFAGRGSSVEDRDPRSSILDPRQGSAVVFPAPLAAGGYKLWVSCRHLVEDFLSYLGSAYENSLWHLLVFAGGMTGLFFGRHVYQFQTLQRARRELPLCIGGWGTRGKSGTERLKAAVFAALGYAVVSKSTGCEAMFMISPPHGRLREMFLFRPYDKATIWEQRNLVLLAAELNADVYLWECMGLTPSYVDILQRQWMKDDISTITNTYPDHEDLQGPAGVNVAETISTFIPRNSRVVTTEQEMRPVLREEARRVGTELVSVGWLESGLLTDDVLDRFPYREHPDNIALVARLAGEIGIERDFALKAMADELVPDLGVLKTYPPAHVLGRRLEFTNGMSANERRGCLGNWTRLGFDRQDPCAEPGVWITTVVNNRADRIPRSRVFAGILVHDIRADRHFLIGGNLKGLTGYLAESWDEFAAGVSLWPREESAGDPAAAAVETLRSMARRFRQPTEEAHVKAQLRVMLTASRVGTAHQLNSVRLAMVGDAHAADLLEEWSSPETLRQRLAERGVERETGDAVFRHQSALLAALGEYRRLEDRIRSGVADRRRLESEFQELLRSWFDRKIVVIDDYDASGEQIIHRIARETPPGFLNRIMGLQNIKGTGLDFVYRFQAWDRCHEMCRALLEGDPAASHAALRELAEFAEFGQLTENHLEETVERLRSSAAIQDGGSLILLDEALGRSRDALEQIRRSLNHTRRKSGFFEKLLGVLEQFLDLGYAVKRRKTADRIYRDLAASRIAGERAAAELRALQKHQKGGWLAGLLRRRSD